jgi:ribosomal protein S12 methylthiotransferase accessory factor
MPIPEFVPSTPERRVPPQEALRLLYEEIESLHLRAEIRTYGQGLATRHCLLYRGDGRVVGEGMGKGIGLQSTASAVAEALERLISSASNRGEPPLQNRSPEGCIWSVIAELPHQEVLARDKAVELLLQHHPGAKVPCRPYKGVTEPDMLALYPLVLTTPDYPDYPLPGDSFDYTRIRRYCTNSGTALGLDVTEAMIHAVCERIERDAESLFLISTFLSEPPRPVRLVAPDTLPLRLRALYNEITELAGVPVMIIDITTDIGVPSFCAVIMRQEGLIQPRGCGCSLSKEYAVERAMLEALQDMHVQEQFAAECHDDHVAILSALHRFPRYQAAARMNVAALVNQGLFEVRDFADIVAPAVPRDLDEYLAVLVDLVEARGFHIFYSVAYQSSLGITCLNVLIPGLENFQLVKSGNAVLPGGRGRAMLQSARLCARDGAV